MISSESPDSVPQRRKIHLVLAALLAWAVLLFAVGIHWGMPSWVGWCGDELHPTSWTTALSPATPNGWHARYPPLHFMVLAGLSWPVRAMAANGTLHIAQDDLIVDLTMMARVLSLLFSLGTLYLIYRTGSEIYGRRNALFAVLVMVSVAPFAYYSKTGNLDAPYVCWFTLSVLCYVRFLKRVRLRDGLLFAAAAAAAVCTKDQAYGLYTLAPLPMVFAVYRASYRDRGFVRGYLRAIVDRRILLTGAMAAALFALFQDLLFDPQRFRIHLQLLRGPMSENYQDFPATLGGEWQLLTLFLKQIGFALNPVYALLCAGAVVWALARANRSRRARVTSAQGPLAPSAPVAPGLPSERRQLFLLGSVVFLAVSYYVTFLDLILFTFDRYVLPVTVLLSLLCGWAIGELLRPGVRGARLRWAAFAAAALYGCLYAASVDFRMLADTRYQVEDYVKAHAKDPDSAIGVGRRKHIPRFEWVTWERVFHSDARVFQVIDPEYIAVNLTDIRHDREADLVERLKSGELGYRLVFDGQSKPLLDLLNRNDVDSSQRFIDPEIALFERVERVRPAGQPAAPAPSDREKPVPAPASSGAAPAPDAEP